MKNQWWQRLWTFQEFIVARKLVIVMGHLHILWEDFYRIVSRLFWVEKTAKQVEGHPMLTHQYLPLNDFLLWIEVHEAVMARTAYKDNLPQTRPLSISNYLIQTRNRQAQNPRDKLYGLYYLFETFGYQLPKIDYERNLVEIYREIVFRLVQQSRSWWVLTHLFNRREISTLEFPSWVPDFGARTVWHQQYSVRIRNLNTLQQTMESVEGITAERMIPKEDEWKLGKLKEGGLESGEEDRSINGSIDNTFLLEEHLGSIKTSAIFLWTVTTATSEMPANAAVDLTLDRSLESVASDLFDHAREDFLYILASWLKLFESSDTMQPLESEADLAVELPEQYASFKESQMMKAIACAFSRSFFTTFRAEDKTLRKSEGSRLEEKAIEAATRLKFTRIPVVAAKFLPDLINNIRRCISPDERHPCSHCMTKVFHQKGEAVEHLYEWEHKDTLFPEAFVKLLYCRAVDHSLFRTNATGSCGGHFGFCRNLPRAGDDVVMLPGLPDPVILRRRAAVRPGDVDTYSVVGVTTGMLGPPVLDLGGDEKRSDYCFGKCPEMANLNGLESRSFYLI